MITSRANYKPPVGEKNTGDLLVETAGYIPAEKKIQSMIDAGRRLMDYRSGYEFQDGEEIPDDYSDPTRNPNFDLADASALRQETIEKMASKAKKQAVKAPETKSEGEITPDPKIEQN